MKRIVFSLFILLLVARSCFYLDDSRYYVEVSQEYMPTVTITSNFDTIDSIMIVDSLMLKYAIEIDTGRLYYADIYLDNLQLFRSDMLEDSLWLYPGYINDGETYDIVVRTFYKKFSGSLADIINAEFFITDSIWTATFFKELE